MEEELGREKYCKIAEVGVNEEGFGSRKEMTRRGGKKRRSENRSGSGRGNWKGRRVEEGVIITGHGREGWRGNEERKVGQK